MKHNFIRVSHILWDVISVYPQKREINEPWHEPTGLIKTCY